tara:strand:- start:2268 stop:3758 length:1491 start_codon:yes stop_codon:yes gene_type:complete
MPTQLKIIADNYSPNQASDVGVSAPFTINFQSPIIISPGQKIAMDKFVSVIPDITANFALDTSLFTLSYCLNGENNQSAPITVPAGKYSSLAVLLTEMTKLCNNSFSGFTADTLPVDAQGNYNSYRDRGLKILCSSSTGKFFMEYVTCPFDPLVLTPVNLETTENNYYIPSATGAWDLSQSSANVILTKGGGSFLEFKIVVPTAADAITDGSQFFCGLTDDRNNLLGLFQSGTTGLVYLRNSAGIFSDPIDNAFFLDDTIAQFYQSNGYFQLRLHTVDGNGLEITQFDTETSAGGAYSQSLGTVNYNTTYRFQATGIKTSNTLGIPAIGGVVEMTIDVPFGATEDELTRTVAVDFSTSGGLRAGLGVTDGLLLFTPQNSDFGAYLGNAPMNLSKINSSFDLALEILDIPLQTFQGNSSRNQAGSRNNVICYFRPELSNVGTNSYVYDSLAYQWLDIAISYPVNLSSLSFRVYNPYTGQNLVASSLTFNLMISDLAY